MNHISCVSIDLINADKPPAALAFLAGACEATNIPYSCFSLNSCLLGELPTNEYNALYNNLKLGSLIDPNNSTKKIVNKIINYIEQSDSNCLLVSLFSFMQLPVAQLFLTEIRNQLPNIIIIAGGPGINYTTPDGVTNGKRLLKQGLVDFYCLGEGDELLISFLQGESNMLGLNSQAHPIESWVPQIYDLDKNYLVPSYQKIETANYHNIENKATAVFSISSSRGCVRDCAFCDVGKTWKKFRFRSGLNVAQEILKHHLEVGAVNFTIVDSLINGSLKSFNEFNIEVSRLKHQYPTLKDFSYNGMFIVRDQKTHTEQMFAQMKDAGCESLAIGVETGSDRLRFEMNKKFTNIDLDYHFEMCQKYGIRNSLLTFVGYPTETAEDFQDTLAMLDRYQKYLINDTIIGINHSGVFSLLPDTPIFENREEIGIHWEYQENRFEKLSWFNNNNPTLTIKERVRRDLAFRQRAIELRYPIPYSLRYLEYMKQITPDFVPVSD